jgi:hypothetical protein
VTRGFALAVAGCKGKIGEMKWGSKTLKELQERDARLKKLANISSLTCQPLEADLIHARTNWYNDKRNEQFWGRSVLRCLCATIEARLFTFRTMALELSGLSKVQFDPKEIEILTEQRIKVNVAGVKTVRPKFLPISDSVKESFRLFGKSLGATITIDYSIQGYRDFCEVFEIRNRLMHPKGPFDVGIDVDDIAVADRGVDWFNRAFTELFEQCKKHMHDSIAKMTKRS